MGVGGFVLAADVASLLFLEEPSPDPNCRSSRGHACCGLPHEGGGASSLVAWWAKLLPGIGFEFFFFFAPFVDRAGRFC